MLELYGLIAVLVFGAASMAILILFVCDEIRDYARARAAMARITAGLSTKPVEFLRDPRMPTPVPAAASTLVARHGEPEPPPPAAANIARAA
jgi:hypothetical protein